MDARFGDGDGLLLHDFMYRNSIDIGHLVELVNTDDAPIGENHRARFESSLPRVLVGRHRGSETNAGAPTAGRSDGERGRPKHKAEHL